MVKTQKSSYIEIRKNVELYDTIELRIRALEVIYEKEKRKLLGTAF